MKSTYDKFDIKPFMVWTILWFVWSSKSIKSFINFDKSH